METQYSYEKSQKFFLSMNKLVMPYLNSQDNKHYGNNKLYLKATILFLGLGTLWWAVYMLVPYYLTLNSGSIMSRVLITAVGIILAILLGLDKAGLGFNVMHDALHGSFVKSKKLNRAFGYVLNLLGGEVLIWDWQHNEHHHSEVNIDGRDQDIDLNGFGRLSPEQPYKPIYKYQHIYLWFLYGLSYFGWKYILDYKKAKKMGWNNDQIFMLFVKKLFTNYLIFLIIPFIICPFWYALTVYIVTDVTCGLATSWVFQLAHVVSETEMLPNTEEKVLFDPFHQIKSTASFAVNNKFLTWFTGGLNFQTIHHLYPWVSHVHYPELHIILCSVCKEFNIEPIVFDTIGQATASHQKFTKKLGQAA